MMVMSVVSGMVQQSQAEAFEMDYAELARGPLTPGLVRSQLLKKPDDVNFVYRIETLWESVEMLDAMRARPDPPEAIRLFLKAGNQPSVEFYDLAREIRSGADWQSCDSEDGE
jgi:hypothetical protein